MSPHGHAWLVIHRRAARRGSLARFEIAHRRVADTASRTLTRSYRPCPVPSRVRDSIAALLHSRVTLEAARRLETPLLLPPYFPPVTDALIARDGSIWLRREGLENAPSVWERVDAMGAVRGQVLASPGIRFLAAAGRHIWGTRAHPDSVLTVHRWRID